MEQKIEKTLQNLNKRKINAKFFKTKEEVKEALLEEIKPNMTVGIGGSVTIKEIDIYDDLVKAGNEVYWHWMAQPEELSNIRKKSTTADIYLTSTNALTEGGELLNIDGTGNRVVSMIFGPKKTIVVCGINKISPDLISGVDRIKRETCARNAQRLNRKTPCATTGQCSECEEEDRMCNVTTIISRKPTHIDLNVYIVGEHLGY